MIAVLFEVEPREGCRAMYLDAAERLRPRLDRIDGFVSIERFQSLARPSRLLSLSYWRVDDTHRLTQTMGREHAFAEYRLRVARVLRDYGMHDRAQAPADARRVHG